MKIGLTYDLRDDYLKEGFNEEETAEFDRADTIIAIETTLRKLGYETDRIGHARSLMARLVKGDRWDLVFNIAEGMYGIGREAQVPAILDACNIPYTFSDTVVLGLSLHKPFTKQVLRDAGLPTPDFFVVRTPSDVPKAKLPFPVFAKPVAEGTGKGVTPSSKIGSSSELDTVCRELLARYQQPVLVETFLPGKEYTVGIVGTGDETEALGTLEVRLRKGAESEVYSYVNKERCEELVDYVLVNDETAREACRISVRAWRALECRDAGRVDLRCDGQGRLQVLELNPLAGLHPHHSDLPILCNQLGIPYIDLMDRIMRSALSRTGMTPPRRHI